MPALADDRYVLGQIPPDYADVNKQTNALDKRTAEELSKSKRVGGAFIRSNGVLAYVQPDELKKAANDFGITNDKATSAFGMTFDDFAAAIGAQEKFHTGALTYNFSQVDPKKRIPGPVNEILGEVVPRDKNPKFAAFYGYMVALNQDVLAKAKQANLAQTNGKIEELPQDYSGIALLAHDAAAKTLQHLNLSDGSGNPLGQQFLEAFERSIANDRNASNGAAPNLSQDYYSFVNKLALDAATPPQQVEKILVDTYSANLDEAIAQAARVTSGAGATTTA